MPKTIGLIPAGGKAVRFNGISKELLPVDPDRCGLTRCYDSMLLGGAEKVVIATTGPKYNEHARVTTGLNVKLVMGDYAGLWECIADLAKRFKADQYFFAMPDTVYPLGVFSEMPADELVCVGIFQTFHPERFGVIQDGKILDKCLNQAPGMPASTAWGVWAWSGDVMDVLADALRAKKDHTAAFELIMHSFGYKAIPMEYYYDFASFEYYREFLCSTHT